MLDISNPGVGEVLLMGLSDQAAQYIVPNNPKCEVIPDSNNPTALAGGQSANLTYMLKCNAAFKEEIGAKFSVQVLYADKCGCSTLGDEGREFGESKYCKSTDPLVLLITFKGTGISCTLITADQGYCDDDDPRTEVTELGVCLPKSSSGIAPCVGSECGTDGSLEVDVVMESFSEENVSSEETGVEGGLLVVLNLTGGAEVIETNQSYSLTLDSATTDTLSGEVVETPITLTNPEDVAMNVTITVLDSDGNPTAIQGGTSTIQTTIGAGENVTLFVPVSAPSDFVVTMDVVTTELGAASGTSVQYSLPVNVQIDHHNMGKITCKADYECAPGTHCTFQHCCPVRDVPWFWSYESNSCRADLAVLEVPITFIQLGMGSETLLPIYLKNPYPHVIDVSLQLSGDAMIFADENPLTSESMLVGPTEEKLVLVRLQAKKTGQFSLVVDAKCDRSGCLSEPALVDVFVFTQASLLGDNVRMATAPAFGTVDVAFLFLLGVGYSLRRRR
jgi:hypothetical protein